MLKRFESQKQVKYINERMIIVTLNLETDQHI